MAVEYDGTPYAGWQRQPHKKSVTVQGEIETALGMILQENISLVAAGRTDKGVHAKAQTANFFTTSSMEPSRMAHSLNALLPNTIRVNSLSEASLDFHARYSAKERHYRYFLIKEPSAIYGRFTGCSFGRLDIVRMQQIAGSVIGVHDFSAFSRKSRDSFEPFCTVTSCNWYYYRQFLVLQISANRFLRSMVRYLVDGMMRVGKGVLSAEEFSQMLETGVMTSQLNPASAAGLFLWKVIY